MFCLLQSAPWSFTRRNRGGCRPFRLLVPHYSHDADQQAWVSALRPKKCLLAVNRKLRDIVAGKLILDWSPEQISGWLKTRYPNNAEYARVPASTV